MAAHPETGRADLVLVRLSDVPESKRLTAANRLIKAGGLTGTVAMDLKMAALVVRQDPELYVSQTEWLRVCGPRRKRRRRV